jgi:hypothetical protein
MQRGQLAEHGWQLREADGAGIGELFQAQASFDGQQQLG